ncbi:MAG TPA: ATP12 family protein [Rhizomicrobium sp.]
MKRFYKSAAVKRAGDGFGVTLDDRPVKTPSGAPLVLATAALAQAIAAEWAGQGDTVDRRSMPLTGLANTALDHGTAERAAILKQLGAFAGHDLVCYRASEPPELVAREARAWDAPLQWARSRYGLDLQVTLGTLSVPQPGASALEPALSRFDEFRLTGLLAAAGILKSVVLALSLADGRLDAASAHAAGHVDALFQAEKWGRDSEAEARLKALLKELEDAERFMRLT